MRTWIQKRENRDSVQEECEDLYAGAGNCTGCPIPDTCLVNTLETGLNIATIVFAILGPEQQLTSSAANRLIGEVVESRTTEKAPKGLLLVESAY